MDNAKYKSVAVPNQVHDRLKKIAYANGRTIGGQMAYMVTNYVTKQVDKKEVDIAVSAD